MPAPNITQFVNAQAAENFGKKWTHNGVAIFMDRTHYAFAADFANIVITSFIEQQNQKAAAAAKAKQIISTEG